MKDIVIVGGGVSGLVAGIYAQKNGYKSVILEKNNIAGGNLTGWFRQGKYIDNCLHWLVGTNKRTKLYKMWEEVGAIKGDNILKNKVLYSIKAGDKIIAVYDDFLTTLNNLLAIAPEDTKEIKSLFNAINATGVIMGSKRLYPKFFIDIFYLLKYHNMSCLDLSHKFKSEVIKEFIVSFLGEEFSAISYIYTLGAFMSGNAYTIKGGSLECAKRLKDTYMMLGGDIYFNMPAKSFKIEGDKITGVFAGDRLFEGERYICTLPPDQTARLLNSAMPKEFISLYKDERFKRFSAIQSAFSCDSHLIDGDYVLKVDKKFKGVLGDRLILRQSCSDGVLQTMTFLNEAECKDLIGIYNSDRQSYYRYKIEYANICLECVKKEFNLNEDLKLLDVWTPCTYKRYFDSTIGSFMAFTLPKGVLPKAINCKVFGFDNLYYASQWQNSPGGLPNAMQSGYNAINSILKDDKAVKKPSLKKIGNIFNKDSVEYVAQSERESV